MSVPAASLSSSSREKKRIRDRRAQNARRARVDAYVLGLEQQAETCRQQHGRDDEALAQLQSELYAVQRENSELRRCLQLHGHFDETSECCRDDSTPVWAARPKGLAHDALVEMIAPWLLCPAVVLPLSDTPLVEDILYGTRHNPLANALHIAITCTYSGKLGEPERTAMGWIAYVWTKWVIEPTPARYARLPTFLRPTELQKSRAHSGLIDFVFWPQVRDELISTSYTSEELRAAVGSYISKIKISWPADAPFVEAAEGDAKRLVMSKAFSSALYDIRNWTLSTSLETSMAQ